MTREEAILWLQVLKHSKINWVGEQAEDKDIIARCEEAEQEAFDMAIEALSANATIAKIKIDDIDNAKTSSQLLDDLAVDMVNAMGKRIVEVVRCKDCRWYENRYGEVCHNPRYGDGHANYSPPYVDEEYWCKDGERREP